MSVASSFIKVAACSYEGSLFGWNINEDVDNVGFDAKLIFGFNPGNSGSLKALAISRSGKYLVSGGSDEMVKIFNVVENKGVGELTTHSGSITCLEFFEDSYLLSGSDDCTICIWRIYDWRCVHILGGHKAAITGFSIHPTGKLALSISKDGTMKLWNLVQGRCSFTRRLRKAADHVKWHETGEYYLLVADKELQLYKASDNSIAANITQSARINQSVFTKISDNSDRLALICDDKMLYLYDFSGNMISSVNLTSLFGSTGRPRDMYSCTGNLNGLQNKDIKLILCGASDSDNIDDIESSKKKANIKKTHDTITIDKELRAYCLAIVSSQGALAVLSTQSLEHITSTTNNNNDDDDHDDEDEEPNNNSNNNLVDSALLAFHHIKVEPRLTAVVAWNPSPSKGSLKKNSEVDDVINRITTSSSIENNDNGNDSDDDNHDNNVVEKKSKDKNKNKKTKREEPDVEGQEQGITTVTTKKQKKQDNTNNKDSSHSINKSEKLSTINSNKHQQSSKLVIKNNKKKHDL